MIPSHSFTSLLSLPFEGFLEAWCRVAVLKALPTDAEIIAADCIDAPEYLAKLKLEDKEAYEEFMGSRAAEWGTEVASQPLERCVAHLLAIAFREMQRGAYLEDGGGGPAVVPSDFGGGGFGGGFGGPKPKPKPPPKQTKREAAAKEASALATLAGEATPVHITAGEVGMWFSRNESKLGLLSTGNTTRSAVTV